jgi:hypothetical protein
MNFPSVTETNTYCRTKRGDEWCKGAEPVPEDVAGFMLHLSRLVPSLDTVISQYVEEGLGAFRRGAYFPATVMLGAACEKEIYLLGDSLKDALKDSVDKVKLEGLLDGRSLYRLLNAISTHILSCKKPQNVFDGAHIHLTSLFDSIRGQRNDAVHPNTASVNEASVRLCYNAFPGAIAKAELLRGWFSANPRTM